MKVCSEGIVNVNVSILYLVIVKKNRGGYFCINKLSCDSVFPKELAEFESFSISLKKLMFTNIFSERPKRE